MYRRLPPPLGTDVMDNTATHCINTHRMLSQQSQHIPLDEQWVQSAITSHVAYPGHSGKLAVISLSGKEGGWT
jgi:hypothetical protein